MPQDTIIAISTPRGPGGLGIVRLSGKKALAVAKKIFKAKKRGAVYSPGLCVLGYLCDPTKGQPFDEALMTCFKAPLSYTREDVVEISCHGSPVVLEEVLRLGIQSGARQAHPGEFTLRAYRNGRLDVIQAEAVNDLINAVSFKQARISFKQLGGSLSRKIASIRKQIIRVLSRMEAAIEFPDEKLEISRAETISNLEKLISDLDELVAGYDAGRALVEGIVLAIAGKTNVGKSTLFNALLEQERAIVTPYPGTTRDFIKERLVIQDTVFHLIDMAGIGRPSHPVEKTGMRVGEKLAREAEGILLVFDASRRENEEDVRLLKKFKNNRIIIVINKIDMDYKFKKTILSKLAPKAPVIELSALKALNLEKLKRAIYDTFVPSSTGQEEMILHSRQKISIEEMSGVLKQSKSMFLAGQSDELCVEEMRKALPLIGVLTGEVQTQEVIDDVFRNFCVGK